MIKTIIDNAIDIMPIIIIVSAITATATYFIQIKLCNSKQLSIVKMLPIAICVVVYIISIGKYVEITEHLKLFDEYKNFMGLTPYSDLPLCLTNTIAIANTSALIADIVAWYRYKKTIKEQSKEC